MATPQDTEAAGPPAGQLPSEHRGRVEQGGREVRVVPGDGQQAGRQRRGGGGGQWRGGRNGGINFIFTTNKYFFSIRVSLA